MKKSSSINAGHYLFATIWLVNGFFCKLINMTPRHQQIVAGITGSSHARQLTALIGIAETGMAIWILSGRYQRINVITQIALIAIMNLLECMLVPDLLLWGRFNGLFALLLIAAISFHEFYRPALTKSNALCSPS